MTSLFPHVDKTDYFRRFSEANFGLEAAQIIGSKYRLPVQRKVDGTNLVFRLGEQFWLKFYCPFWAEEFYAEVKALEYVRQKLPLQIQEPLETGHLEGWNYLITNHIEGIPFREVRNILSPAEKLDLAEKLSECLVLLHQIPAIEFGRPAPNWETFIEKRFELARDSHQEGETPLDWLHKIELFLEKHRDFLTKKTSLHLIHADLHREHLFFQQKNGSYTLTGLIDFADTLYGRPEYEFVDVVFDLFRRDKETLTHFFQRYGYADSDLNGLFSEQILAWALLHQFFRFGLYFQKEITQQPCLNLEELARQVCPLD